MGLFGLLKGPARFPGLAKGSCQMCGGILPSVVRFWWYSSLSGKTLFCGYMYALTVGHIVGRNSCERPWLMSEHYSRARELESKFQIFILNVFSCWH